MSRYAILAWCACLLLLPQIGCGPSGGSNSGDGGDGESGYKIVATTAMVADIVRQVAGDKATVTGLLGEGTDPHAHNPTPSDIKKLDQADVVFYSGLFLEARMTEVFESLAKDGKTVHALGDKLQAAGTYKLRDDPAFGGHPDPHIWMDVSAWSQCVDLVAEALGKYDAKHADYYKDNAKRYQQELTKLDDYVRETIKSIPDDQRVLVTAHDAFAYFARAYGITVHAPQGVSTNEEVSVAKINQMVDFIVKRKIKALFTEDSVNEKNLNAVIEGAKQQGWMVKKSAKKLFSDSMGAAGTYEGTYVGMLDHNATTIARELGAKAPEKGMNGKLSTVAKESGG